MHVNFEPARLAELESRRIHSEMNKGNWWWDLHDQPPAGVLVVLAILASDKSQLIKISAYKHAWSPYLTIDNIAEDIYHSPKQRAWIPVWLIACPPNDAKNTDQAWDSVVGSVLFPLRNLDIAGPGLKWNYADGFHRQFYPLLAAWVRDYPEQVIVADVSYGSCAMCQIPKGAPMGHSTVWPLDNRSDPHIYLEHQDKTNIDVLHSLGVHPLCNQFWQYHLGNVYRLLQPEELHQLLLGSFKD